MKYSFLLAPVVVVAVLVAVKISSVAAALLLVLACVVIGSVHKPANQRQMFDRLLDSMSVASCMVLAVLLAPIAYAAFVSGALLVGMLFAIFAMIAFSWVGMKIVAAN